MSLTDRDDAPAPPCFLLQSFASHTHTPYPHTPRGRATLPHALPTCPLARTHTQRNADFAHDLAHGVPDALSVAVADHRQLLPGDRRRLRLQVRAPVLFGIGPAGCRVDIYAAIPRRASRVSHKLAFRSILMTVPRGPATSLRSVQF